MKRLTLALLLLAAWVHRPIGLRRRLGAQSVQKSAWQPSLKRLAPLTQSKPTQGTTSAPGQDSPKVVVNFVHIPKAAGTSFLSEMPRHGLSTVTNREACLRDAYDMATAQSIMLHMTMVRSPRAHFLSMFLECAYDGWGQAVTANTLFPRSGNVSVDFETWVDHFLSGERLGADAAFGCYNPQNLQTRAFTCSTGLWNHTSKHVLHLPSSADALVPPLDRALETLTNRLDLAGLVELYPESWCLVELRTKGQLPSSCNCTNAQRAQHEHITHGVPKHHWSELSTRVLEKVDRLSVVDARLYMVAANMFLRRISKVEQTLGVRILCDDRRAAFEAETGYLSNRTDQITALPRFSQTIVTSEHRNCSPLAVTAKPRLAFGAMIRNEAPYLLEWVEFHLLVGFDIFYLWDDGSTDASLSVIQPYVDAGVVLLDSTRVKASQEAVYTKMVRQANRDGVEWLMLSDVDVFVFPERAMSLRDVLTGFNSSVGAIGLCLSQFDHNGRMKRDADPVIERFVHRRKIDDPFNGAMARTSSLLRVKNVVRMGIHHPVELLDGTHFVDVLGSPLPLWPYAKGKDLPGVYEVILANHYYCKSYEEFKTKNARNQKWGSKISTWSERCEHPWQTGENDTTILKFLPELKSRLACAHSRKQTPREQGKPEDR